MPSFKEWLKEKVEASPEEQRKQLLQDWRDAYDGLIHEIMDWLEEDGDGQIKFGREDVARREEGLGSYTFEALKITVGDESVDVVPIARNVVAHLGVADLRASGRVDITNGVRKYALYRVVRDGESTWHVVKDSTVVGDLSKEILEQILMDLMT